jgi:multicomponent Na+:H+ antiporter subunit E
MPETGRIATSMVKRALLLGAVWLVLAGAGGQALVAGALVLPVAIWLSLVLQPPGRPLRLLRLAAVVPGFLWRSFVGGVDVAWRAFHPRLPLDPGWVRLPVMLPDGGKVALGGELSLMPGTLVAGSEGDLLLVHLLDRRRPIEGAIRIEEARIAALLASPAQTEASW